MSEYSSTVPGTFCWPELATTDQKAAVAFYRGIFGWDVLDSPMGPGEVYSMFTLRGAEVGAACTLRPEQRQHGVPPHWGTYISVANADDSVARAKSLGATVLAPPFDVMDAGRMAVLQDPTGAIFMLWQGKKHPGAKILNEPGALGWTELMTRDTKKAGAFYTALFGWTAKANKAVPSYTEFSVQGVPQGGMMAIEPGMGEMPPNWLPYFRVADADKTAARAKELGATIIMGPRAIENVGRFAVIQDPQGAVFAIIFLSR